MTWTTDPPRSPGWYKWRKGGVERRYFIRHYGFTNRLMPSSLFFAFESEDSKDGTNIDAIFCDNQPNDTFKDCEWEKVLNA